MSVLDHLRELRKRFILAIAGICVGAVIGWYLYDPVMEFILRPLSEVQDARTQINFQTIGAGFDLKMRLAFWIGFIVTSPWWIYQIGAFLGPGLKRREKAYAAAFGIVGVVLFAAGAWSAVNMAPRAVEILQSFVVKDSYSLLQADAYVTFYTRLVIAFGLSYLLPEILVALNFLGVLPSCVMLKGWRWAIVASFVFAAIANPLPSPWPMTIQAAVLILLFLVAVGVSWGRERILAWRSKRQSRLMSTTQGEIND